MIAKMRSVLLMGLILCSWGIGRGQSEVISDQWSGRSLMQLIKYLEQQDMEVYTWEPWVDEVFLPSFTGEASLSSILEQTAFSNNLSFDFPSSGQLMIFQGDPIIVKLGRPASLTPSLPGKALPEGQQEFVRMPNQVPSPLEGPQIRPLVSVGTGKLTGTATVSGMVRDVLTGTGIAGATIAVPESGTGTFSDSDGYFSLTLPVGAHEIRVRSLGMSEVIQPLSVSGDGEIEVEMEEAVRELDEVVIEAEVRSNIDDAQMGVSTVSIQTMKQLPSLLGEVDIVKTAVLLPGVQTVGEGAAGFNVRGGGADQNLVLLSHAPIFNPNHLFGFFSAFHPDLVSSFQLYKSGIPARFGGRISSVFDIGLKDGNRRNLEFKGGISPITARLSFEGPITKDKGSFIIGGRSTYSDWILNRIPDVTFQNSNASFQDLTAHVSYDLNPNNQITVSAYGSRDRFTLNRDTTFGYTNIAGSATWKHFFTPQFYSEFTGVYSQYDYAVSNDSNPANAYQLGYQIRHHEVKSDFTWLKFDRHYLRFGAGMIWYQLSPGYIQPGAETSQIASKVLQTEQALESAVYLSDEWRISDRLLMYGGLRMSAFQSLGPGEVFVYSEGQPKSRGSITDTVSFNPGDVVNTYQGPEARLALRYSLNEASSVKFSYNRMRQYLHRISNTVSIAPTDTWKLSDPNIRPQVGDQFSLGYFRNFRQNSIETSAELYYKPIQNLIDYKSGADLLLNEHVETELVNARGRAYGLELLIRKNTGKLTGWLGYTYSRTWVQIAGDFQEETVNNGRWFPASFDKPHDLTTVLSYKVTRRLSFSGNMTYSTGRPITFPVAQYTYGNSNRVYYSERNAYRIPDYFRVDLGLQLEGNHKVNKLAHSSWSFSVYNVLGRKNPYSIYFVAENGNIQGYQLSIFGRPFGTVTYEFRM